MTINLAGGRRKEGGRRAKGGAWKSGKTGILFGLQLHWCSGTFLMYENTY